MNPSGRLAPQEERGLSAREPACDPVPDCVFKGYRQEEQWMEYSLQLQQQHVDDGAPHSSGHGVLRTTHRLLLQVIGSHRV